MSTKKRTTYFEKLSDPRWQKRRLEIFKRDGFTCQSCRSKSNTLHVHHLLYSKSGNPWESPDSDLISLCADCHKSAEDKETLRLFKLFMSSGLNPRDIRGVALALSLYAQREIRGASGERVDEDAELVLVKAAFLLKEREGATFAKFELLKDGGSN